MTIAPIYFRIEEYVPRLKPGFFGAFRHEYRLVSKRVRYTKLIDAGIILSPGGNGVAAYIYSINEARKVLVEEARSTLFPIGKDVKIQIS